MSKFTNPLSKVFNIEDVQFLTNLTSMPTPAPGSEAAQKLVEILRFSQQDPFENNRQRERFVSEFNAILDTHNFRIDIGPNHLPCRLDFEYTRNNDGSIGPHRISYQKPDGHLVGLLQHGNPLGIVDVSSRIQDGHYNPKSKSPITPLTNDSRCLQTNEI